MVPSMKAKMLKMAPPTRGQFYDPERDGVTQGILGAYKRCRELARNILMGWAGKYPAFPLVYGSLAHYTLEQAYRQVLEHGNRRVPGLPEVKEWLNVAKMIWEAENPIRSEITTSIFEESLMKNQAILPLYFKYWKTDFTTRHWIELERSFRIPWTVTTPDGRTHSTFIRGKIDGAFTTPKARSKPKAPRLFETKNLSQVSESELIDTLPMNLQTSLYSIALWKKTGILPASVEYNIIRKTALRQGKKESWAQYEARITADVKSRMDWYFVRMEMTIDREDIERMQREIDALIGDFLMWWYGFAAHYRNDQSCYAFHRPCDMIKLCTAGDPIHLFKRERVFSELEE